MAIIIQANRQDWNSSGVPGNTIVLQQGGTLFVNDRVLDINTGRRYICTVVGIFDNVDTYSGCAFIEDIDETNLLPKIESEGWEANTARDYITQNRAFNTSYQPSDTNDVELSGSISLTSTLILAATVDIQVDTGSGFVMRERLSVSGIASTQIFPFSITIPVGAHYKLIQVSGVSSIININEVLF